MKSMTEKSFDKNWEENIYSQGKHLNQYPYDMLVSLAAKKFFHIPREKRSALKALDLGCGAGNNSKFLAESGFSLYGIDGSETAVNICRQRFKQWKLTGNFIKGDFLNLPYEDDFFDFIVDRESLYANKFADIEKALEQVRLKLKSGGALLSFIYNTGHPDREFGEEIEPNTYANFRSGSFFRAGKAHFIDLKEVHLLYSNFKIENIIRHSSSEIYNKPGAIMEYDEYVIIAKKKEQKQ